MTSHPYLERGISILHTHLGAPATGTRPGLSDPVRPFLTISREACGGATTLGQHLLPLLEAEMPCEGRSWMFLDKNLLKEVLSSDRLPETLAKFLPEDRVSEFKTIIGEVVGLHPPLWELEQRVADGIHQLARQGCVIFAGRAAHLVTEGMRDGFHIRLVAPLETRISRMQELQHCNRAAAKKALEETDRARERFVLSRFGRDINDPCSYDLVINTERMSPPMAARLVVDAMLARSRELAAAAHRD